jgi:hypothetical protein
MFQRSAKVEVAEMASLPAKRNMYVNTSHYSINEI